MEYESVIGLEVHVQLQTKSKLFCGCLVNFGAAPNSQTCPVCLGLPGVLPVFNRQAFEWGIRVALALDATVGRVMKFDRKQYFYPDLPKNYQISQYDQPLARRGSLTIDGEGNSKRIGIHRIHLEEDAGKLLHSTDEPVSFVDFNRAGVPLLEIVSEPDLRSTEEAYQYLVELKAVLQYLEVSNCNMEEGSLRCDTNVSLRRPTDVSLGAKVEIKNLNSFRAVRQALEYELKRQALLLDQGSAIALETRLWDAKRQRTESMRSKEDAADYRYFPEPDLVPFVIDSNVVEQIQAALPELPAQRRQRFQSVYQLSAYDAHVLTQERTLAELFERTACLCQKPKAVANWIMGDLLAYLNAKNLALDAVTLRPEWLAQLIGLVDDGTLSGTMAKEVWGKVLERGIEPAVIVREGSLQQIVDVGLLEHLADSVIREYPKSVEDYSKGKANALMYLVGQGMKRSQGKANPQQMTQLLKRKLDELRERITGRVTE